MAQAARVWRFAQAELRARSPAIADEMGVIDRNPRPLSHRISCQNEENQRPAPGVCLSFPAPM
jgi:hypothetical protein